jgi:hypothetical protein
MQPIYNAGFFSFENKPGFLFGIFKDRKTTFFCRQNDIFPPSKRAKNKLQKVSQTPPK